MQRSRTYPIRVVSRRTGLSQHVIRAWERRYSAVTPLRTGTNRRLYTEEHVERLRQLRRLVEAGHSIGTIAGLPTEELSRLINQEASAGIQGLSEDSSLLEARVTVQQALAAIQRLDGDTLDTILRQSSLILGQTVFTDEFLVPLLQRIGSLWSEGRLEIVNEHIATSAIRTVLGSRLGSIPSLPGAPVLISTTPTGQIHELGALLVANAAAAAGWKAVYVGPNLPAEEIVSACRKYRARVVALSIIYPAEDPIVTAEIEKISKWLPGGTFFLVGGRATIGYGETLVADAVTRLEDLASLRQHLRQLALA